MDSNLNSIIVLRDEKHFHAAPCMNVSVVWRLLFCFQAFSAFAAAQACWNLRLRYCNFLQTALPTTAAGLVFLLPGLLAWHPHSRWQPCGGSFQIHKPGIQGCKWMRIPISSRSRSVQALHTSPVNALHFDNVVCLALLIMWPGNHSSQPRLSSPPGSEKYWNDLLTSAGAKV